MRILGYLGTSLPLNHLIRVRTFFADWIHNAFSLNVFFYLKCLLDLQLYSMNAWRYDLQYDYKSTDFKFNNRKVLSVKKNSSKEV